MKPISHEELVRLARSSDPDVRAAAEAILRGAFVAGDGEEIVYDGSQPDVRVLNEGTIWLFRLLTAAAQDWVKENVQSESWQWLGGALAVEHRYAPDLVAGMRDDGLTVEEVANG